MKRFFTAQQKSMNQMLRKIKENISAAVAAAGLSGEFLQQQCLLFMLSIIPL